MNRKLAWILPCAVAGVLVAVLAVPGCARSKGKTVSVVGSTSIQPFAELLKDKFRQVRPDITVEVQGGGSTHGLQTVSSGMADIGTCSRDLSAEESRQYNTITIARDGIAIIVNPANRIASLTPLQVGEIFSGEKTMWNEVGGEGGRKIQVISREEGSGTRETFVEKIMKDAFVKAGQKEHHIANSATSLESNGAVIALVKSNPNAIGYISLGLVDKDLRAVPLKIGNDAVPATAEMVHSGKYTLARPFLFVTKKGQAISPAAQAFIDYVLSDDGQATLEKEGLIRALKGARNP